MRRIKCAVLAALMLFTSAFYVSAEADENDLSYYLSFYGDSSVEKEISLEMPPISDMVLISDNGEFRFYYYADGADIYLINSRTGKIWSNVLQKSYVDNEKNTPMYASQLITVSASNNQGSISDYVLYDSSNTDILVNHIIKSEVLQLNIEIPSLQISFSVDFGFKNGAFFYKIDDSSISEKNGKLVLISLLNNFGASRADEDGYIFYPDGSGAIMNFKANDESNAKLYQMNVYGSGDVTYKDIDKNEESNIFGLLLPVYGVSQHDGGFLAVASSGDEDASLYIASPGYQLSQVYSERISAPDKIDQYSVNIFIDSNEGHCDKYICKGGEEETFEPRFTYHGFRYAEVSGNCEILSVEACLVHADLPVIGDFECDDEILNWIHQSSRRSTLTNYFSFPTDCPHREQNGWTGDAALSVDQCLYNYEIKVAYLNSSDKAEIIITTGFWKHIADGAIREYARKNEYPLVELNDLGEDEKMKAIGLFEHDGVANHPGDLGMEKIAGRIFNVLKGYL